jgi:DNA-binding MarR family transcriptional regulator
MTRWLDDREQQVWRSWIRASSQLEAHLARRMQADADISMSDFAVLVPLSEAPDQRLRAFALGRSLQWEKSRLSHHLTRMERRALETAAGPHVEAVRAAMFDRLSRQQVERLGEICDEVLAGLDPDAACAEAAECTSADTACGEG